MFCICRNSFFSSDFSFGRGGDVSSDVKKYKSLGKDTMGASLREPLNLGRVSSCLLA
jgi:hypothetical protein